MASPISRTLSCQHSRSVWASWATFSIEPAVKLLPSDVIIWKFWECLWYFVVSSPWRVLPSTVDMSSPSSIALPTWMSARCLASINSWQRRPLDGNLSIFFLFVSLFITVLITSFTLFTDTFMLNSSMTVRRTWSRYLPSSKVCIFSSF